MTKDVETPIYQINIIVNWFEVLKGKMAGVGELRGICKNDDRPGYSSWSEYSIGTYVPVHITPGMNIPSDRNLHL